MSKGSFTALKFYLQKCIIKVLFTTQLKTVYNLLLIIWEHFALGYHNDHYVSVDWFCVFVRHTKFFTLLKSHVFAFWIKNNEIICSKEHSISSEAKESNYSYCFKCIDRPFCLRTDDSASAMYYMQGHMCREHADDCTCSFYSSRKFVQTDI